MLNETFYLDGIDARSVGIQLQAPVSFSEAVPVAEAQTIPGRNGDIVFYTGSYENRSGSASCFCLQKDVEKAISAASRFLMGKKGYRRLETSDDPDHYWMARVENSPQIAMRVRRLAPFDIDFDCKPQRFLKSGEEYLAIDVSGQTIENLYMFDALPLIKLTGTGSGTFKVNETVVEIKSMDGILFLDSDTQNAYNIINANENRNIKAPVFPVLRGGENVVEFSGGIESVEIMPRWWEL